MTNHTRTISRFLVAGMLAVALTPMADESARATERPAPPVTPCSSTSATPTFDGTDVGIAIGTPYDPYTRGNVHVYKGTAPYERTNQLTGAAHNQRGRALAAYDVDGDGCDELFSGAPMSNAPKRDSGAVTVYRGSKYGLVGALRIGGTHAKERFGGSAIAVGPGHNGTTVLWVSSWNVKGVKGAGAVTRVVLKPRGTLLTIVSRTRISEATSWVPGTPEPGDRFGESLAMTGPDTVLVGAPGEGIGPRYDVGVVYALDTKHRVSHRISQNSPGIPTKARGFEGFGAAIVTSRTKAWISAPYENAGGRKDNGAVFELHLGAHGIPAWTASSRYLRQGKASIPGSPEKQAKFGTAMMRDNHGNLWISSPWQSAAGLERAGAITVVPAACPTCARTWSRDDTTAGNPERGGGWGGALGLAYTSSATYVLVGSEGSRPHGIVDLLRYTGTRPAQGEPLTTTHTFVSPVPAVKEFQITGFGGVLVSPVVR